METAETKNWHAPITGDESLKFEDLIDSANPTVVMKDSQLTHRGMQARAQLRSIPLLHAYGFNSVLHTEVWDNQFKLVDYDSILSENVDDISELSFPLVHVVTQAGITEHGEEELVRELIQRSMDEEGQYVLVTDTVAPKTPAFTKKPGKSVVDEFPMITVQSYDHLSSIFLEEHLDSQIPVVDTRNLFFHTASTLHELNDAPSGSIDELFDYTAAPTESPVWEPARYFLTQDLENVLEDYSERIREALRSWNERGDTQRVANKILQTLQITNYSIEEFEQYRKKSPSKR